MATELRAWTTTDENFSPYFFKVDISQNQLLNYKGADGKKISLYHYRTDLFSTGVMANNLSLTRWIASKVFDGWNNTTLMATAPQGKIVWKTTRGDVPYSSNRLDHQPAGTIEWTDDPPFQFLRSVSYRDASATSSWGSSIMRVLPQPSENTDANHVLLYQPAIGYAIIQTSDNQLVHLYLYARRTTTLTSDMPGGDLRLSRIQVEFVRFSKQDLQGFPDPSTMLSTLIESSDDEGSVMARYNPRTQTSTVGCYVLDKNELLNFEQKLWTTDLIDSIRNSFIGDGSNALLGVKWYYGIKNLLSYGAKKSYITMGNVAFRNVPQVSVAVKEFVVYDAGSVVVPKYYGDYRDWTITTYQMYIPFVGVVDLKPEDVVGKTVYLKYWINISDGSAICSLSTTPATPDSVGTLFTTSCSWGYDIPIRVDSALDSLARMAKITSAFPIVGGAISGAFGGSSSYSVGELSPNSNIMGDFQPKIIVYRRDDITSPDFVAANGRPSGSTMYMGEATGYLKVKEVYNSGQMTMRRADEIIAILKEGVYM